MPHFIPSTLLTDCDDLPYTASPATLAKKCQTNVPPRDADIAARLTVDYRLSGLLVATACTILWLHITGLWRRFDPIEA